MAQANRQQGMIDPFFDKVLSRQSDAQAVMRLRGIRIDLDKVPVRETGMTPYEIMLSESQERMLLVGTRGREEEIRSVFAKWDLDAVEIGRVTADGILRARMHGDVVAEVPKVQRPILGLLPKLRAVQDNLRQSKSTLTDYRSESFLCRACRSVSTRLCSQALTEWFSILKRCAPKAPVAASEEEAAN